MKQPTTDPGSHRPGNHYRGQDQFRVFRSEELEWKPFPAFPPQARLAVLVGEPTRAGPYLIRVKLPADTRMMPHKHSEDRIYTVISGVFYIGLGEQFDETKLTAHAPGSVLVLPSGESHFQSTRPTTLKAAARDSKQTDFPAEPTAIWRPPAVRPAFHRPNEFQPELVSP